MEAKIGFIGGKFSPVHLGHIFSITKASTYVDALYVIVSSSVPREKKIFENSNMQYIEPQHRLAWLGEIFADNPIVKIMHIEDKYGVGDYDWEGESIRFKESIFLDCGYDLTHVFSAEEGYAPIFAKLYPECEHIIISKKNEFPISSTKIRDQPNIFKVWDYLPDPVRAHYTKKIAIVGTESCGKTTLAANLARIYSTNYVPEVGRKYCEKYKNQLTPEMFDDITMEHHLLQQKMIKNANKLMFVDSDAVITLYYLNMYLGLNSSFIDNFIVQEYYDVIFYLEPDVDWVDDGIRFAGGSPNERKSNNDKLIKMYKDLGIQLVHIDGSYAKRLEKIMFHIRTLFGDLE